MPMSPDEIEEMKSLIAVGRKRPLNFAICMGKDAEGTVFLMHRMKEPDVLARMAKKSGETAKVAFGELNVTGKQIILTCVGDIPAGIARRTKMFLTDQKMPMKVVALDSAGNVGDDDGEELPAGEAAAEADTDIDTSADISDTVEPTDPLAATWEQTDTELSALVARVIASDDPRAAQIEAAWDKTVSTADQSKYAEALAMAARLKPILLASTEQKTTAVDPNAAAWVAMRTGIETLYEQAMALDPANRSQLETAWGLATEKADDKDTDSALKIAARLKLALEAVIAQGAAGAKAGDVIPDDVVPFQRARILWENTRAKMLAEMAKLEDAIIAVCAGDEELAEVADNARSLTIRLNGFDTALESTLEKITVSAVGPAREALKQEAMGQIRGYATLLSEDFFKEVDTGNGFTNVAVAATARQSLAAIAKTLG